jgi:DNA-binding Lrp family transcriptional regulator
MKERKKKIFDGIDKEILRVLSQRRPLVSRQIAKYVGLSSAGITSRLENLENLGIIKKVKKSKIRVFKRSYGKKTVTIHSPRNIFWDLDLIKEK